MAEIAQYIGGEAKALWLSLLDDMAATYKVKPKMAYSGCSGKPGWNVKLQKSGVSFGTLYPEENAFSVFLVIAYRLDPFMEACLPALSPGLAELYRSAGDYMKMGKWMMFQLKTEQDVEDYKRICAVKAIAR
jgi:hypothetical protein